MTDFCGIPLASLRENSITELNLEGKGIGVPGAIVLSKLLPSAAALTSLKCAAAPSRACQAPLNTSPPLAVSPTTASAVSGLSATSLVSNARAAPTPPRASLRCARGSRVAP